MTPVIIIPVGDIILSAVHQTLFSLSFLFLISAARPGNGLKGDGREREREREKEREWPNVAERTKSSRRIRDTERKRFVKIR